MSVTLAKIAALAGVSVATVSQVLNGNSRKLRINPDTEAKVCSIASKLNYVKPAMRFNSKNNVWQEVYLNKFAEWLLDSSYRIMGDKNVFFDIDKQDWATKEAVVKNYLTWLSNKK